MKKILLLMTYVAFLVSCAFPNEVKVTVKNSTSMRRVNEMVEISDTKIATKLNLQKGERFVILNESNQQIPYQVAVNLCNLNDSLLIFQVSATPNSSSIYTIKKGIPEHFSSKTFGKFVPERKDDFAWENDRIAFRMYGPALKSENPSNGVDVWLKKTDSLIVGKFYHDDLNLGIPYHIDHGQGLDCYKVDHTLGAGGVAPYTDDTLWIGNQYDHWKIIENGPLRTTFELEYDSIKVENDWIKENLIISIDAGSQLNKGIVSYSGTLPDSMQLGVGLFLHDEAGTSYSNVKEGVIGYGETATSDAGIPEGRDFVGVVIPNGAMQSAKTTDGHLLAICKYNGTEFTYYFGAGWNQWGFENDKVWFNYLLKYSQKLEKPLKVSIK